VRRLYFVTHADVVVDPEVPVPDWGLAPRGVARHAAFAEACPPLAAVFCSTERKARDGAEILARAQGVAVQARVDLGENDRSATGYLCEAEFEATAEAFFAEPTRSVRGWERAVDAQARIVAAVQDVLRSVPDGSVAVVAHGGVGALFRAHLLGEGISRVHDQPGRTGGNLLEVDLADGRLLQGWTPIEDFEPGG